MSFESRILALERKNQDLLTIIDGLRQRLVAVEQSNAQNWTAGSWTPPASGGAVFGFTTPGGGIAAGGSATCTLTDGGTATVFNLFTTAIAGGKQCVGGFKADGTTRLFLSEDC